MLICPAINLLKFWQHTQHSITALIMHQQLDTVYWSGVYTTCALPGICYQSKLWQSLADSTARIQNYYERSHTLVENVRKNGYHRQILLKPMVIYNTNSNPNIPMADFWTHPIYDYRSVNNVVMHLHLLKVSCSNFWILCRTSSTTPSPKIYPFKQILIQCT